MIPVLRSVIGWLTLTLGVTLCAEGRNGYGIAAGIVVAVLGLWLMSKEEKAPA
jgi:hypothetical protein